MDEPTPRILDGYRLIRFLGSGGFGEVWLCRSEAMGDFRAIKLIQSTRPDRLEREHESLMNYRAVAGLRSPHLVPIEHINWYEGGLCYVMPLADGTGGDGPEDPDWQPLGLDLLIEARREGREWFTSREIVELLRPVLLALQTLSEAKLVHRDVKPANILFFEGRPRLGDVSLLGEDSVTVTRRGTPGYAAPSWYEGGHPDMYSVGATLYALLTGNPPDKMGRAAFLWPPQGEGSLSEAEREEWGRLHAVVRRATDERVSERYVDFAAMLVAVEGGGGRPAGEHGHLPRRKRLLAGTVLTFVTVVAAVLIGGWLWKERVPPSTQTEAQAGTGVGADEAGITPSSAQTEVQAGTGMGMDAAGMAPPSRQVEARTNYTTEEEQEYQKLNDLFLRYTSDEFVPERVLSKLDEILDKYPQARKYPHFSIERAAILQRFGRLDEAKEELRKPVHVHFNGEAMGDRTRLWERLGELGEAEKNLTRIIDTYGPSTDALRYRAEVRAKRGDYAGVEADRQAALLLNPDADAQKLAVDIEWGELEDEYPGYREYWERLHRGRTMSSKEQEQADREYWERLGRTISEPLDVDTK